MTLHKPLGISFLFLAAFAFTSLGCADPESAFNEFNAKAALIDSGVVVDALASDAATCVIVTQDEIPQNYLFTLSTKIYKAKPILALTQFTLSELNGAPAISLHAQPLDVKDKRTPVGNPIVGGPYAIKADGSFVADLGVVTVPGEANPISGSPIVSSLVLEAQPGAMCKPANFICGPVTGIVTEPAKLGGHYDLSNGSNFTFQEIVDLTNYPSPLLDCARNLSNL